MLKAAVCKTHARPAFLYGSEVWFLRENNYQRTIRSMMRTICEAQFNDRKRDDDLMQVLGLNEAINQLATVNSEHW